MNDIFKPIDKLSDIPSKEYIGYIWKSDESIPKVLNKEAFPFLEIEENPFIIEGYLYSEEDKLSISIKYIDGKYFISQINLKKLDLKSDNFVEHKYLSDATIVKQNSNFKYIKFVQFWEENKDNLCENMNVLQPAWSAFVGFEEGGKNVSK